jgi:hypothetical protein
LLSLPHDRSVVPNIILGAVRLVCSVKVVSHISGQIFGILGVLRKERILNIEIDGLFVILTYINICLFQFVKLK